MAYKKDFAKNEYTANENLMDNRDLKVKKRLVMKKINKNKLLVNILDLYILKVPLYTFEKLLGSSEDLFNMENF